MKKKIMKIIMLPFTLAAFTTKFSQTIKKKLLYCITYPIVFEQISNLRNGRITL